MTALVTESFRNLAASSLSLRSTMAEISSGANSLLAWLDAILTLPLPSASTRYGTCLLSSCTSPILRPMKRFTEKKVFSGLTTAWRLAICGGRRRREQGRGVRDVRWQVHKRDGTDGKAHRRGCWPGTLPRPWQP